MSWHTALTINAASSSQGMRRLLLLQLWSTTKSMCVTSTACAQLWYCGVFKYPDAAMLTKVASRSSSQPASLPTTKLSISAQTAELSAASSVCGSKSHMQNLIVHRVFNACSIPSEFREMRREFNSASSSTDNTTSPDFLCPRYCKVCSSLSLHLPMVISLNAASFLTTHSRSAVSPAKSPSNLSASSRPCGECMAKCCCILSVCL
mmetsp:Transcript_104470/g.207519  ORF Transcript_104470/g.207519 Transcript_104470/m.207519 type:complete len:206 (-) Transcript_104470:2982-3599(-)